MNRLGRMFVRERTAPEWRAAEQNRIAVAGLSRCAGATTVASALALFLAAEGNRVSFVECADPGRVNSLLFESCGMGERFQSRIFTDVYEKVRRGEPLRGIRNTERGVNWILITPENVRQGVTLDEGMKGRLIQAGSGTHVVFDMDLLQDPSWKDWILDMDQVLAVVDPMPSRMMTNGKTFGLLKSLERSMPDRFTWLINRVNPGISRRQVRGYLRSSHILEIPGLPDEIAYGNEFRCRLLYEDERYRQALDPVFRELFGTDAAGSADSAGKHDPK